MDQEDGRQGGKPESLVSLIKHDMHMTAGAVCFTGAGF